METIAEECGDRGFELQEVASGYRFQVKQELSEWVSKLWEERPPRYTRALLETLALVAYRQPITRGDIEEIRGVGVSSNIIRTLLDREWIRVVGHRDVPGRPAMFATTKQFLDYFNLKSLQELPTLSEIKELEQSEKEVNLQDELLNQRVLDMPEDAVDEKAVESVLDADMTEAELEALALAEKPLDEILNPDQGEQEPGDSDFDDDLPAAGDSDDSEESTGESAVTAADSQGGEELLAEGSGTDLEAADAEAEPAASKEVTGSDPGAAAEPFEKSAVDEGVADDAAGHLEDDESDAMLEPVTVESAEPAAPEQSPSAENAEGEPLAESDFSFEIAGSDEADDQAEDDDESR
jgi:segregation and condensation protein B